MCSHPKILALITSRKHFTMFEPIVKSIIYRYDDELQYRNVLQVVNANTKKVKREEAIRKRAEKDGRPRQDGDIEIVCDTRDKALRNPLAEHFNGTCVKQGPGFSFSLRCIASPGHPTAITRITMTSVVDLLAEPAGRLPVVCHVRSSEPVHCRRIIADVDWDSGSEATPVASPLGTPLPLQPDLDEGHDPGNVDDAPLIEAQLAQPEMEEAPAAPVEEIHFSLAACIDKRLKAPRVSPGAGRRLTHENTMVCVHEGIDIDDNTAHIRAKPRHVGTSATSSLGILSIVEEDSERFLRGHVVGRSKHTCITSKA